MPVRRHTVQHALTGIAVAMGLGLSACAPTNTNTIPGPAEIGRTTQISYGTIVSMRGIVVQSPTTQAGGAVGRNDVRGTILSAVGGGGLVGPAIETAAPTAGSVEFIIQEDNAAAPISVVQTNELKLTPGERIVLTRGARTRIARPGV